MSAPALLFMSRREWEELKLACKEAAGWQCEYIYANGMRCSNHEGQTIYKGYITVKGKRKRKKSTMHMQACHLDNDPQNPKPRLECRCPMHHTKVDRQEESEEKPSWRRRGYQITTTDRLLEEVNTSGVTISEEEDGYHWQVDAMEDLKGVSTTAVRAVGVTIHQMRCLLHIKQGEVDALHRELEYLHRKLTQQQSIMTGLPELIPLQK
ncbi:MAG: hypothetical protein ACRDIV_17640 [Ktedonobacteraceae bacterium]